MEKKYRHPWLPYPHTWLLVLLSILLCFLADGWVFILFLWLYKCFYIVFASFTYEKRRKRRWEQTEKGINSGENYVFPDESLLIKEFGIKEGNKLLEKAKENGDTSTEAKEKHVKLYREQIIKTAILQDCGIWKAAYVTWLNIPWIRVKEHSDVEKLFKCPDPSCYIPQNYKDILLGIYKLPLSEVETEYINTHSEIKELPDNIIENYKRQANDILRWNMKYEDKEKRLQLLRSFAMTGDIKILDIKEEDIK